MNNKPGTKLIYASFILLAGILWGFIGLFSTMISRAGYSPVEIAFIRTFITAMGIFIIIVIKDRKMFHIDLKDLWMFLGTGIGSIVFFNVSYFITIDLLNLSLAAILLYSGPFFVVILSALFFKESLTKFKILILIMASIGCAFTVGVFNGVGTVSALGVVTGLISGLAYGLYSIFGKVALKKYGTYTVIFYTFLIASLTLSIFSVDTEFIRNINNTSVIIAALGIGIFSTIFPFILYTIGLKNIDAGKASIMTFAEPVVATIIGVSVFKDDLTFSGIFGMILIFISLVLLNLYSKD